MSSINAHMPQPDWHHLRKEACFVQMILFIDSRQKRKKEKVVLPAESRLWLSLTPVTQPEGFFYIEAILRCKTLYKIKTGHPFFFSVNACLQKVAQSGTGTYRAGEKIQRWGRFREHISVNHWGYISLFSYNLNINRLMIRSFSQQYHIGSGISTFVANI